MQLNLRLDFEEALGWIIFATPVSAFLLYTNLSFFPGLNCNLQPGACLLIGTVFTSAAGFTGFLILPFIIPVGLRTVRRRRGK